MMKRFLFTIIVSLLFSFNSFAAFEMAETHKGITLPDAYWAFSNINIKVTSQSAYVTLALYANEAAYLEDPDKNKLREFDYGWTIGGADYQTIFNPTHSVQQIVGDVYVYIKTHKLAEEEVNYFENADIVP